MIDNRPIHAEPDEMARDEACREWLGVQQDHPTHYELLRLPNLLGDRETIFEAGRQAKRKLRAYQIGRYRKLALSLLVDVGQAVAVLTNPEKKRVYDHDLVCAWQAKVEGLHEEHVAGREPGPEVLRAWLTACRDANVPVVYLLPFGVRLIRARGERWPPHGEHRLSLPACLWLYRDIAILGQCLAKGEVARRAEIVKGVQKALGVPEDLARIVAEEVSRAPALFSELRFVRQAKRSPNRTILRLGRRIRRLGGHVDRRNKVVAAAAKLLGRSKHDFVKVLERLDEPPVEISAGRRMAVAARKARRRARAGRVQARRWVRGRPQILLGVGLAIGLLALVLAVLVVLGVVRFGMPEPLFGPEADPTAPLVPPGPEPGPELAPGPVSPPGPPPPPEPPTDGWEDLIERYPAEERAGGREGGGDVAVP